MDKRLEEFKEYFQIIKIDNRTYAICEDKISYRANCFLLIGENEGILIDALSGVFPNFIKILQLIFYIKINKLLLTHAHYDHFGGYDSKLIKEVYVSEKEKEYLTHYYLTDEEVREEINSDDSIFPSDFNLEKFKVNKIYDANFISEGDVIGIPNRKLRVVSTPGHTDGSLSFYEEESGYLFVGDFLYNGLLDIRDIKSNLDDFIVSLEKIRNLNVSNYLCGHYKPWIRFSDFELTKLINVSKKMLGDDKNSKNDNARVYKTGVKDIKIRY